MATDGSERLSTSIEVDVAWHWNSILFLLIGCLSRNNWLEISICLIAIGMVVYWLFDELKKKK
jgi:hypothetical protein